MTSAQFRGKFEAVSGRRATSITRGNGTPKGALRASFATIRRLPQAVDALLASTTRRVDPSNAPAVLGIGVTAVLLVVTPSCGGVVKADGVRDSDSGAGGRNGFGGATSDHRVPEAGASRDARAVLGNEGASTDLPATGGGGGTGGGGTGGGGTGGVPATGGGATAAAGGKAGATGDPCAGVRCIEPICSAGMAPHVLEGTCCPICGPNCRAVDCADPGCTGSELPVTPPGKCCPVCVPIAQTDAAPTCDEAGYASLRTMLTEKYTSSSCNADADCTVVTVNVCGTPDCGVALLASLADSFESNLVSFATSNCGGCAPVTPKCPPDLPYARCENGVCTLAH